MIHMILIGLTNYVDQHIVPNYRLKPLWILWACPFFSLFSLFLFWFMLTNDVILFNPMLNYFTFLVLLITSSPIPMDDSRFSINRNDYRIASRLKKKLTSKDAHAANKTIIIMLNSVSPTGNKNQTL